MNEEIERENNIFQVRAMNAEKLKRIQAGLVERNDKDITNDELLDENGEVKIESSKQNQAGAVPEAGNQAFVEISLAMREQTKMFKAITEEMKAMRGNTQTDEAIKSIEKMAHSQLKTKAILTKEPKCPKFVKEQKWESYWKEFDRYEKRYALVQT